MKLEQLENSRALAALVLEQVIIDGKNLDTALQTITEEKAFVQHLSYGVCRYYWQLKAIEHQLLTKPIKAHEFLVSAILLVGIFQLLHTDVEPYAAVNECVEASKILKKQWASKLINASLRRFLREKADILASIAEIETATFSHPKWLLRLLQKAYPNQWQTIAKANNQQAAMTLRVNQQKISRTMYCDQLIKAGISASPTTTSVDGIVLAEPTDITQLLYFAEGFISVQDEAAQCAAQLLELESEQHVLDACAAPGGKTCHLLEKQSNITLTAIDNNAKRASRINDNLQRLQLQANVIVADANEVNAWWDGNLFDRILCDAPCSATGVIRRHPDIKLLRRKADIDQLQQQQLNLLNALWPLLKTDGILLYATCSVLPQENDEVIKQFVEQHNDVEIEVVALDLGIATEFGRQLLPGTTDGFYYTKLRKKSCKSASGKARQTSDN